MKQYGTNPSAKQQTAIQRSLCMLCGRTVNRTSKHHIVPRSEGGVQTVDLCLACHKTVHAFFTNHTLAAMHSLEALRQHPEIQRYLSWIRKQPDSQVQVRPRRNRS